MFNDVSGVVGVFFFFQAEDGIRDIGVTGVQTCALPIFAGPHGRAVRRAAADRAAILEAVSKLEKPDRELIPDVTPTVEALAQIGRASCRERGEISVVAVSLKKKQQHSCL